MRLYAAATLCLLWTTALPAAEEDYAAQRMALAARPGYDAYGWQARQSGYLRQARAAWSNGRIDDAVARFDELLDFYPLSIVGHAGLAEVLAKRAELATDPADRARDARDSESHRHTAEALVASITHATRCATIADACRVINVAEEYEVIRALGGGRSVGQSLLPNDGVPYDVITVRRAPDADPLLYYFDISAFYAKVGNAPAAKP